jgi:hypothetical protein
MKKQEQQNKEWEENYYPETTDTPMTMTGDFFEQKLKDEIVSTEEILKTYGNYKKRAYYYEEVKSLMEEYANQFKKK